MTTTAAPRPIAAHEEGVPAQPADVGRPVRDSLVYLGPVYVAAVVLALAIPGTVENPGPVSGLTALVPALVVGIIRLIARRRHAPANPFPLGMRRLGLRSWPAAIVIPAAAIIASFAAAWAIGVVGFDGLGGYVAGTPFNLVLLTFIFLGEEIGWRSYLLPRLASVMPVRRASVVTGFAQALFHLPLLLLTDVYDGDGSRWIVVPGVVVVLTAAGPLFGWLRVRSASLWPATIAHAAVNTALVEAPVLISDNPDTAAYLTSEGGLFTVVIVMGIAAVILRRANWTPRTAG
ncbi:hypothetical protein BH10ACT1_BH10ACT1_23840 [soil metagenome]